MDDAGEEDDGQSACLHDRDHPAHAAQHGDAAPFAFVDEGEQESLGAAEVGDRGQRQAVTRGRSDQIDGAQPCAAGRSGRADRRRTPGEGMVVSRKTLPSSRPQTSKLTVPGSMPMARVIAVLRRDPLAAPPVPDFTWGSRNPELGGSSGHQMVSPWAGACGNLDVAQAGRARSHTVAAAVIATSQSRRFPRRRAPGRCARRDRATDGAVDLHLQPADPQGTERDPALALLAIVRRLDPLDTERWHRVDVGHHFEARVALVHTALETSCMPAAPAASTTAEPARARPVDASSVTATGVTSRPKRARMSSGLLARPWPACATSA